MHGWFGRHRKMWMEAHWMMGRHHGGRPGFGRGFGGPGGFGEGDEGEGGNPWRGRRLSSADLQLVLLALLKDARATATS